jgi:rubredoxin
MSYDFTDGPDYNPEPQGDEYAAPADDDVRCPDCKIGTIIDRWRCDTCGLSWDDLLAADEALREAAAR